MSAGSPACPICGKPHDPRYRPFCSRRCADVDLGRWVTGSYALPGPELGTGEDIGEDIGEDTGGDERRGG
jgi:endogenous inhibitor of DNA gyrase (YacG/DUF329 family)